MSEENENEEIAYRDIMHELGLGLSGSLFCRVFTRLCFGKSHKEVKDEIRSRYEDPPNDPIERSEDDSAGNTFYAAGRIIGHAADLTFAVPVCLKMYDLGMKVAEYL